ncbi:DsbA family protein [Halomarina oriensis]|uniref:DsbA family oxidoreductase n=1 Tax=Halomarina oriensis TaxID=671145 RepID=UPI0034A4A497
MQQLKTEYGERDMLSPHDVPRVDSLLAQSTSLHVRRQHPKWWSEFDDAVFRARWVNGRDIGSVDTLRSIAEETGVPGDTVREVTLDGRDRSALFECFEEARRRGVTDVPTFVHQDDSLTGVHTTERLQQLVAESSSE